MDDFEKEIKNCFLDEAAQSAANVEQCFLSLEKDPKNIENLNQIFRLAHNLKGSSNAVGFSEMGEFTHEMETFILKIKKGELEPTPNVVNLLLEANDFLTEMIRGLKANLEAKFDFQGLLNQMKICQSERPTSVSAEELAQETAALVAEMNAAYPDKVETMPAHEPEMPAAKLRSPRSPLVANDESIRVAVAKVEKLINYVGEMVIIQSVLSEQALNIESLNMKKTINLLGKVSKEIQDISMGLRMIPIKPTFQKMARIVRDTAVSLNKEVQLNLIGEDTELDKTVLEKINDPLVHLIRNSIDHGIESTQVRIKQGKNPRGQVDLKAYHKSGRLIIEVSDDGGGLNGEKLVSKAIEKGLLKPGTKMSDKDAYQLIFLPGFSTKEQITDLSGRGIGMDVVKTNLLDLGGEISIESEIGKGTCFRVSLPLTLAIVEALIVTFSGQKFVVPLGHVYETVPTKDHVVQFATGLGDVILLRGENLRLFRLGDFFGIRSLKKKEELITIVVRTGTEPFAIMVDDILGQHQVVVKQLSPDLSGFTGVSGTTILGDGKPALILELADLLKRKIVSSYHSEEEKAA